MLRTVSVIIVVTLMMTSVAAGQVPVSTDRIAGATHEQSQTIISSELDKINKAPITLAEQGNETQSADRGATTTDVTDVDEIRVGVSRPSYEGSYKQGGTVDIWVAAVSNEDVPTPISNIDITLTVTRPDETTDTFNVTTDSAGNARISYDLSNKPTGEYSVEAQGAGLTDEDFVEFNVGPHYEIFPQYDGLTTVGQPMTFAITHTAGFEPVSAGGTTVVIEKPDGTETQKQIPSGSNGVTEFTYTPTQSGEYQVQIPNSPERGGDFVASKLRGRLIEQEFYTFGQTATIAGTIVNGNQPYANRDIRIEVRRDGETVTTLTATTNGFGQFVTQWTPSSFPEDDDSVFYDLRIFKSGGDEIPFAEPDLYFESSDTEQQPELDVSARFGSFTLQPGQSNEVTVTVTDDDQPVANADVALTATATNSDVPIAHTTLQTNTNGKATYTVAVPDAVMESFRVYVNASKNDRTGEDIEYADIRENEVDEDLDRQSQNQFSFNTSVTKVGSDTPVSNHPVTWVMIKQGFNTSIVDSGVLRTNQNGEATTTINSASSVGPVRLRGRTPHTELYENEGGGPIELTGLSSEPYQPGETISIGYNSQLSESSRALLIVRTWDEGAVNQTVLAAKRIGPNGQASVTFPSTIPEGVDYNVFLYVMTSSGDYYITEEYLDTEAGSTGGTTNSAPTASFSTSASTVSTGDSIDFDASVSSDSDGSIASYEWDFDGDGQTDATGQSVSHSYMSAGDYTVTLTVTDNDGATATATRTISVTSPFSGTGVQFTPSTLDVGTESTTTVDLQAVNIDNGIKSYSYTISVTNTSVATIRGVKLVGASRGGVGTDVSISSDNSTVTVSVAQGDDTNGVFSTLTLAGQNPGTAELTIEQVTLGDDNFNSYNITGTTNATVAASETVAPPAVVGNNRPTDPDGDGKFDDITGDGTVNILDVGALLQNRNSPAVQNNPSKFDFTGDGSVNILDVGKLLQQVL